MIATGTAVVRGCSCSACRSAPAPAAPEPLACTPAELYAIVGRLQRLGDASRERTAPAALEPLACTPAELHAIVGRLQRLGDASRERTATMEHAPDCGCLACAPRQLRDPRAVPVARYYDAPLNLETAGIDLAGENRDRIAALESALNEAMLITSDASRRIAALEIALHEQINRLERTGGYAPPEEQASYRAARKLVGR